MNHHLKLLLLIAGVFCSPLCLAQNDEAEPEDPAESENRSEESSGSSHETDVSEDNYRRFMELKDQSADRTSLPTAAYVKPASLEKMEGLPEASQKHLRNQLRDIILQSGPWSPEDVQTDYPYTPSEAARTDALARHPSGRFGKAEDIANLATWLASDEAGFASGQCYILDGGMTAASPLNPALF